MSVKKRGLGRGLDALLSGAASGSSGDDSGEELRELAIESLQPGQYQPRRDFDPEALNSLAESIRAQGIVQPIVVRAVGANRYEIVAGERRWRAAQQLQLKTIPAIIRALDERAAMAVALIENIQRADLNALEEAQAIGRLVRDCGLTHEAAATAVGCSRAHVSNLLRLLELNDDVQQLVRDGRLSFGHAKVLLGVQGARQSSLARLVVEKQLSVRQTEALVQSDGVAKTRPAAARAPALEKELTQRIGLPVKLQQSDSGRGKITVSFKNLGELQEFLQRLR